ncbi:RNase3 domain protein [Colletotrichum sojae]|uniref:Dicer-like protein 1 n=1 Tax=Colletotrichum sojae TaxID=2175907 RepID=A0A8H6JMR5_9PEZI|nr:RNase3 domain protein [Colletotrichum sojae]
MDQISRPTTPFPKAHQTDSAIDTDPETPSPKGISSVSSTASDAVLTHGDSGVGSSTQSSPRTDHEEEEDEQAGIDEDDEGAEDEYRRYHLNPAHPRAVSKRKQEHSALLRSLVNSEALKSSTVSKVLDDLSIIDLIKDNDKKHGKKDINRPREYQYELFERAKKKNIIAVLDTGSGKTLIAALLLRHILEKELEDREVGKQKRIAFFLVDKVSLVFQQHQVLEDNLGTFNASRLCGDLMDSMWSAEFWKEQFEKNMIIVCTAAILQKCLSHSYIRMDQINLLIFDEAHHTKKGHPYARIIKDFYMKEPDKGKRPKVFGMTASPVDAQTDVKIAAARLEGMLQSEIATVSDDSMSLKPYVNKIIEREIHYTHLPEPFETELYQKVHGLVRHNRHFSRELLFARQATSFLGPWLSDRLWKLYLTEIAIVRLTNRTDPTDLTGRETAAVRQLQGLVNTHKFDEVKPTAEHLSLKVLRLWEELHARFSKPTNHKCIVFVEMRMTALLLNDFFKQPGTRLPYLNPAILVGSRPDSGAVNMSFKDQILNISKFKYGYVNCLFATQVAEEGLDIPTCNLVIRFDLYKSAIQYIQSRGRAREENSEYLTFIEGGNGRHSRTVAQAMYDQSTLRRFCAALPEDRKIAGFDADASAIQGEFHHKSYVIPSSGAKLTWTSSLEVLSNFTASLRQSSDEYLAPEYVVINQGQNFVAEVQLPPKSPIQSMTGFPHRNKQAARCSAAFELCKALIQKKYIDEHLHPVFVKKLPAMRNARLAVSSNKRAEYNMRTKPEIWSRLGDFEFLFATVLSLESPEAIGRPSKPLIMLTRERLPDLPVIPLFFGNDLQSAVHPVSLSTAIKVSASDAEALKDFTFRIFKDVFSKEYEATTSAVPYFLAPTIVGHSARLSQIEDPASIVDWAHLRDTKDKEYLEWNEDTPHEFFKDKLVTDPYAGSRKLYLRGVRTDMKPKDQVPDGVPDPGHRPWKDPSVEKNITEYSVSLWMKSRKKRVWRETQPVFEAEVVSLRRNLLDDFMEDTEETSRICYVILEPMRVSTLPIETTVMAFTFPAIIHRIDSVLIALDACKLLNLEIRPDLALEAMTKDSDNSEEHDQEKINFQSGMGKNYERLEFLGDCFLKMATTIAIFTSKPDDDEFAYHVERMLLVCNQNLFNKAVDKNLQEYVRSRSFDRRSWYPQGLQLKRGKSSQPIATHALADKSIADVCEALIGAAYLTHAESANFDMAIRAVTAVVKEKNHRMTSWDDYYAGYTPPAWQSRDESAVQREVARQVLDKMGYRFKSPALLRSAFKHPSYPKAYENLPNYQRLEFLGDALLDMVCVDFLYNKFPDADPQWLTEHKMAMVSNQFLASLCVKLGLHKHVLVGNSQMLSQTEEYVSMLEIARSEAEVEAGDNGIFSQDYWTTVKHSPKYLSDVLEAYVGAVFVDSGYDYSQVRSFFDLHIRPFFTDMALYDSFASRHPVTKLGHMLHDKFGCRDWRLMATEQAPNANEGAHVLTGTRMLCGVILHKEVPFHATAESSRYAKIAAAKKAIAELGVMSVDEYKERYKCDCKPEESEDIVDHGTAV